MSKMRKQEAEALVKEILDVLGAESFMVKTRGGFVIRGSFGSVGGYLPRHEFEFGSEDEYVAYRRRHTFPFYR